MSKNFLELGIAEAYCSVLEKQNIIEPTQVQLQAIPEALEGKDIYIKSPTGSGKTLAYLLPLLAKLDSANPSVQAVVIAPTQELAMQIFRVAGDLCQESGNGIKLSAVIGGANLTRQLDKLKSKPQLIVGSVGRILEIVSKGKLKLNNVKTVVLDEADRLLDEQHSVDTKKFLSLLHQECQYMLCSATLSEKILSKLNKERKFTEVSLEENFKARRNMEHWYFICDFRDKIDIVRKLVHALNISRALVFVNQGSTVEDLTEKLKYHKLKADSLSAANNKMLRKNALEEFIKGYTSLLLATDVAARGLDIADVEYVINFAMPENGKVYLHRAGRTARAGKHGVVITLVDEKEIKKMIDIDKQLELNLVAKKLNHGKVENFVHRPVMFGQGGMALARYRADNDNNRGKK